jgi:hypothetical protein
MRARALEYVQLLLSLSHLLHEHAPRVNSKDTGSIYHKFDIDTYSVALVLSKAPGKNVFTTFTASCLSTLT